MVKILAFDASTEVCSVALLQGDRVWESISDEPRSHADSLLPMAHDLLHDGNCRLSEIDAIAFGAGPGSFTGLRICVGVVQGLAFGADIPVVPVSSLQAMAWQVGVESGASHCLTAFDARMKEVYWAVYKLGNAVPEAVVPPTVSPVDEADARFQNWLGAGEATGCEGVGAGCALLPSAQQLERCDPQRRPRANAVARLGEVYWRQGTAIAASDAEPVYIRSEISWKKRTRIRTSGGRPEN